MGSGVRISFKITFKDLLKEEKLSLIELRFRWFFDLGGKYFADIFH
jgi:hypothetical protein